jgi:hypothetical protein
MNNILYKILMYIYDLFGAKFYIVSSNGLLVIATKLKF